MESVSRSHLVRSRGFSERSRADLWLDAERFAIDHATEVLKKLSDGSLDDEIWGKLIIMERGCRLAKAYIRNTTVIVDGGDEEFDGCTLGFNHFRPRPTDRSVLEFREKIGDGVIIKMDGSGNLKAMARGLTPVFLLGCRDEREHCASDRLVRLHGRLTPKTSGEVNDDDRIFKVFEIKKFKKALEKESNDLEAKRRSLFLKSCIRIALVKENVGGELEKIPCWFAIVNVVALEMIREFFGKTLPSPLGPLKSATANELANLLVAALQRPETSDSPTPSKARRRSRKTSRRCQSSSSTDSEKQNWPSRRCQSTSSSSITIAPHRPTTKESVASATSGYDSQRELMDSGSWNGEKERSNERPTLRAVIGQKPPQEDKRPICAVRENLVYNWVTQSAPIPVSPDFQKASLCDDPPRQSTSPLSSIDIPKNGPLLNAMRNPTVLGVSVGSRRTSLCSGIARWIVRRGRSPNNRSE